MVVPPVEMENSTMHKAKATTEDCTRSRLLHAAGEVFADHGFRAATVQMICQRAGANVAAVNYYFRNKESLYHEALQFGRHLEIYHQEAFRQTIRNQPALALELFIHDFLGRLLSQSARPQWYTRLVVREMAEPTAGLDVFIKNCVRPRLEAVTAIVRGIAGPGRLEDEVVQRMANSIIGQCLFYHRCRSVVLKIMHRRDFCAGDIDAITSSIVQFSLGGIRAMVASGPVNALGAKPKIMVRARGR